MSHVPRYLLIDGHSVIYAWEELRKLHSKDRRAAREQLIRRMGDLHDNSAWLVTLVFDGTASDQPTQEKKVEGLVVIYAAKHQTADSIIERITGAQKNPQQITVVTADITERKALENLGAFVMEPSWLLSECGAADEQLRGELARIQRKAKW